MTEKKAIPDKSICVACGVCVLQCPRKAVSIHVGCYATVDKDLCVGCGLCKEACPANAIDIFEYKQEV